MMLKLVLFVILLVSSLVGRAETAASPPLEDDAPIFIDPEQQSVILEYQSDSAPKDSAATVAAWKTLCSRMGKILLRQPAQTGFAKDFKCLDFMKSAESEAETANENWRIQIVEKTGEYQVHIFFRVRKTWQEVRLLSFKHEGELLKQLKKGPTLLLITRTIMDSMPTGWAFKTTEHENEIIFISSKKTARLPSNLFVYDLFFVPKTKEWQTTIRAKLIRFGEPKIVKSSTKESYKIETQYLPLSPDRTYWAHNTDGSGGQQVELSKMISKKNPAMALLGLFDKMLFSTLDSNYFSIRYGKSVLPGSSVVTKVSQISLLFEMRSGILQGLRWYYDLLPKQTAIQDGNVQSIEWRRMALGWSFEFEAPGFLSSAISTVNIQPKVGLIDFNGSFDVPYQEKIYNQQFNLKKFYDLALEFGIEKQSEFFRQRIWTSVNSSNIGTAKSREAGVRSIRFGYDSYINIFTTKSGWQSDILLFANYERLDLEKDTSLLSADEVGIGALGFNILFAGGGFSLSW